MRRGGWLAAWFCLCWIVALAWPAGAEGEKEKTERFVVVTADQVNVRQGPGVPYRLWATVHRGETYPLVAEEGGWMKIQWKSGQIGWLAATYAAPVERMEKVTVDKLRLRQKPSFDGRVIGYLRQGDQVAVIQEEGQWKKVVSEDAIGWVAASYLTTAESAGAVQTGVVTVDSLNVRAAPSLEAERIGRLGQGDRVEIVAAKRGWYQIKTRSGLEGWAAADYIKTDGKQAPGADNEDAVASAMAVGTRFASLPKQAPGSYVYSWTRGPIQALAGKTIVLDAGHGGKDGGAQSVDGVMEKALTIKTAERLKQKLEKLGARVVLTRTGDDYVPLSARVAAARLYQADAFISLHYDSAEDPAASGITVYYYDRFADYGLAQSFQGPFSQLSVLPFRGVAFGDYYVLRENEQPSVLLELGYLSNRSDAATVATDGYQEAVTTAIAAAVKRYFE
ncbi:N-acetylmuramoyl-L-alanine amidase [Geobacillus vulcani]|uniref:N-acetylmuramoyl-L-alanine amidase n=1 Tax=Geobacillus vulcani TaxID=135517 RepID=UPI0004DF36D9|nr:N-acetylmuramoyl-L-alanine amidase [Geobacillus vulcani]